MTTILWEPRARLALRKLPKHVAKRILAKLERVQENVARHLEGVVGVDFSKIRVGDYRLFVDSDRKEDILVIRALRHRRHAYKP